MTNEQWLMIGIWATFFVSTILTDLRHRLSEKRIALWEGECKRLQVRENVNGAFIARDIEESEWLNLIMLTYEVEIDDLTDAVRKSNDWRKLFHEDLKPYMEDVY